MHHVWKFEHVTTWTMYTNRERGKNCSSSNLNVADVGPLDNFWHNADSFFTCGVHFVEFNINRLTFDCYISFACNGVIPALLSDSCESISIEFNEEFNKLFIAIDEPIELQRICRCTNRSNSIPMIQWTFCPDIAWSSNLHSQPHTILIPQFMTSSSLTFINLTFFRNAEQVFEKPRTCNMHYCIYWSHFHWHIIIYEHFLIFESPSFHRNICSFSSHHVNWKSHAFKRAPQHSCWRC